MKFFEIEVFLKNNTNLLFNHNESKFVKDGSEGTMYNTRDAAEQDIDKAYRAWNKFDSIKIVERSFEE